MLCLNYVFLLITNLGVSTMTSIPERNSLVNQTVLCVQDGIAKGKWIEWLPAERILC